MEWISVKDRLPEEGIRVLSFSKFEREMKIDYVVFLPEPIWACTKEREEKEITHWTPLPKPPES